jgi:hypothetical protein
MSGFMDDWMRLPVSQLKRLVKSRAGRVAELQMEIKILEGIMERKVSEGDLGGSSEPVRKVERPEKAERPAEQKEETPEQEAETEKAMPPEEAKSVQSKITGKSSDHAFKEID